MEGDLSGNSPDTTLLQKRLSDTRQEQFKTSSLQWRRVAQTLAPIVVLVLICAALSLLTPRFLTQKNIINVVRQSSLNGIVAAGMTLVILTGGIDLSVGSLLAVTSVFAAGALHDGYSPVAASLAGVVIGLGFGLGSGLVITIGDVAPFIVTLGTLTIARGVALIYTNGAPILATDVDFRYIGRGDLGPIPVPIVILLIVYAIVYVLLNRTTFGGYIYAIGGNQEAARLSGVPVRLIKTIAYAISGLLAGLTGVILTARLGSAQPNLGTGDELDAIAAVVLGGTSLAGGRGGIFGTLVGALIIGVLSNGLNLMNVNAYYQPVAKGLVILIAILVDRRVRTTSAA
jgi:ribose transport system permease protein